MTMKGNKHRAVFLDRDGTICEEVGYLDSLERLHLIPEAAKAIRLLNEQNFKTVVVTNQSGIARGYFSEGRLQELHSELSRLLRKEGAFLDAIYYCPHHPTEGKPPYLRACGCRKPAPGLLVKAAEDLELDLKKSFAVGDKIADLECGRDLGVKGVLVLTGYGREELTSRRGTPASFVAPDLYGAVEWILSQPESGAM
jgi:D-glycero-D-manno-heptose 1,7-bisphosphate phosphatase